MPGLIGEVLLPASERLVDAAGRARKERAVASDTTRAVCAERPADDTGIFARPGIRLS